MATTYRTTEKGYVMVVLALSLTVLVMLVGFAVDLGAWYLRAAKLQRAADTAALSAAVSLPDANAARTVATQSFARNGFTASADLELTVNATSNNVSTRIVDKRVPTYFLKLLFPSIEIGRSSSASQSAGIPLGNPFNVFGSGNLTLPGQSERQNFWAAINGRCSAMEQGDYFMARYSGNKNSAGQLSCPGGTPNSAYTANQDEGYTYLIDIPSGNRNPVNIDIYDCAWDVFTGNGIDHKDSNGAGFNTSYVVWDTRGTARTTDDVKLSSNSMCSDGARPAQFPWTTMATSQPPAVPAPRQLKVQVFAHNAYPAGSLLQEFGVNSYAIMASNAGSRVVCDTRTAPTTCPKIYGSSAVSVMASLSDSSQPTFYLAEVDPGFAGSTIEVFMWDPGEGAQRIELLMPNGDKANFTWTATPSEKLTATNAGSAVPVDFIDVSGTGPQPGPANSRFGTSKYNDRLLTLKVQVPSDYQSRLGNNGDKWWKVRYTVGGSAPTDRATWGVNVGSGSPIHLSKKP